MGPVSQFGIGQTHRNRQQRAADGSIDRRDHIGGKAEQVNPHAHVLRLARVVANGTQVQAKRRVHDAPHHKAQQQKDRQAVKIKRSDQVSRFIHAGKLHAQQCGPGDRHPGVAAGQFIELEQERVDQHAEREREHAEENLHVPHAEHADRNADHQADQDCGADRALHASDAVAAGDISHRIRAQRHIERMAKRHQAGVAEQKIKAQQDDAVGQRRQHQRDIKRRHDKRRADQGQQQDGKNEALAGHSIGFPNRPVGRKIRTVMTIT